MDIVWVYQVSLTGGTLCILAHFVNFSIINLPYRRYIQTLKVLEAPAGSNMKRLCSRDKVFFCNSQLLYCLIHNIV